MATRTVSNTGGNFNATGTWVGGVVPITGDDIATTATSGNLTLTANTPILIGANFTNYVGTLAFGTNQLLIGSTYVGGAAGRVILGSGMTTTSGSNAGRIQFQSGVRNQLVSNGVRVANVQVNSGTVLELSGTASFGNITSSTGTIEGANAVFYGSILTNPGNIRATSPSIWFIRPDTTFTVTNTVNGNLGAAFGRICFDTTNQIITDGFLSLNESATLVRFDRAPLFTTAASPTTYSLDVQLYSSGSAMNLTIQNNTQSLTFSEVLYVPNTTGSQQVLNLIGGSMSMDRLCVRPSNDISGSATSSRALAIIPNTPLTIRELIILSDYPKQTSTTAGIAANLVNGLNPVNLRLASGVTYSIDVISSSGYSQRRSILSSLTASTPVNVILGTTHSFDNTDIIDINNVGTPAYAFAFSNNTLTRTTGITSSFPSSGGGGGGSFTFVS